MSLRRLDNFFRHERCPLCLSSALALVGPIALAEWMRFSSHQIALTRPPELWRCQDCASRFVQNAVPPPIAQALYATGDSGVRWALNQRFSRVKAAEVLRVLGALISGGTSLLDIGCNTGDLLDWAKQRGAETAGVELASLAREALVAKGHLTYAALEEARGPFELITAFDLVEHLVDVPGFLADCAARLEARGRLVVVTGNPECAEAQAAGAGWWYVEPPEHVVFPSPTWWRRAPGWVLEGLQESWIERRRRPSWARRSARTLRSVVKSRSPSRRMFQQAWNQSGPDHVIVTLRRLEST